MLTEVWPRFERRGPVLCAHFFLLRTSPIVPAVAHSGWPVCTGFSRMPGNPGPIATGR